LRPIIIRLQLRFYEFLGNQYKGKKVNMEKKLELIWLVKVNMKNRFERMLRIYLEYSLKVLHDEACDS
jgi:hypothetical protein